MSVENILSVNISDVVASDGIQLKRKGNNFWACCPFHNEKTASFSVSPQKNIFKCFGCGEGGNAISYVMKRNNMSFIEACHKIANDHNIQFDGFSEDFKKEYERKKSLKESLSWLSSYYSKCLVPDTDPHKYASSRWDKEIISLFNIGYAPKGFEVIEAAKLHKHYDNLFSLGYFRKSEKSDTIYPFFQNRIMFPVFDKYGHVIGFSGRSLGADEPKYINSPDSDVFSKKFSLYGINLAWKAISDKKTGYLVEGFADVIKLHTLNKPNVLGSMGTALTQENIDILKKITPHVTIIGDYDPPSKTKDNSGEKAMMANAVKLIEAGFLVNLVFIKPDDPSKKSDPDSFFPDESAFDAYIEENTVDFFIHKANQAAVKASNNKQFQISIIDELCSLLIKYPPSTRERYIDDLSKIIRPKKAWSEKMKEITGDGKEDENDLIVKRIPKDIKVADVDRYGFYEYKNQYHFRTNNSFEPKTNFVLRPIMHIPSNTNAKRIFEIVNNSGFRTIIELAQKDLSTVQGFKLRVESLGNFLYEGSEIDMNKLKRWLYETTDTCEEITQLGWQKPGFWAWANGIFVPGTEGNKGEFIPVDEYGIVEFENKKYYLPAFSKIFENDHDLFQSERKFIFRQGKISSADYLKQFSIVFGSNAALALSFFFATLFRDLFFHKLDSFPILNFFGPKSTGKSDMAIAMLKFFGKFGKGPNMVNSTKPAMADHISLYSNALAHLDEYRNSMDPDKVEFLKSVFDGTGRTRMNMDRDKKKETTKVDIGLLLCGQEMPTLDIALFSRLIFMVFHKTEFSETEKTLFENLKTIQNKGLGHIVHEILDMRRAFEKEWIGLFDKAYDSLKINKEARVEERILKSFSVVLCAWNFVAQRMQLPFSTEEAFRIIFDSMVNQNRETKAGNEVSIFWSIFENNVVEGLIEENVDYKIDIVPTLKTNIVDAEYSEPKTILFVRMTRVVTQYRKTGIAMRESILPSKTIDYYLKNSSSFLGIKNSTTFMIPGQMTTSDMEGRQQRMITTAYCFDYKMLSVDILKFKSKDFYDDKSASPEFTSPALNGKAVDSSVVQPITPSFHEDPDF